jgi:predicted amidohydrolase YtcJ
MTLAGNTVDPYANRVQVTPANTPEEILDALVEYANKNPGDGWIRGGQWGPANFPSGEPNKTLIDEVIPDRPVILIDETVHGAWVNSKALKLAGITSDTPQPTSGIIRKDPETGEPTGYLADGGMTEVLKLAPKPTLEMWKKAILDGQDILHGYGITAMLDAAAGSEDSLAAYKDLESEGKLKMRVDYVTMLNDYMADAPAPWELIKKREQYDTRLIDVDRAKLGYDGVPISGASLLLEPYTNNPDTRGQLNVTEEQMTQLVDAAGEGMQIMIHAIGDGTIRKALDTIEEARATHPENTRRAMIAHPIWAHPDDIPRFKELNVIADVSPPLYFWTPLMKSHLPVLGEQRMARAMPIRQFLEAGVLVVYGSDWPASAPTADPWGPLEGMITRQNPHGEYPGETLGEPIDLPTALKIFTINGAIAMEHDHIAGSIEVGKSADMIVLNHNLFELIEADRVNEISETLVTRTLFEGEIVHILN